LHGKPDLSRWLDDSIQGLRDGPQHYLRTHGVKCQLCLGSEVAQLAIMA
jgi:hypothetical protein